MKYEKISVIIPVYNSAQYLMRAVDSIKAQKYPNLEIILIDDGSTDGSDTLCDRLSKCDNQIKAIHSKNEGPAVARNKGLNVANGKYIYFMDSDDYLTSKLFLTVTPLLEQYDMIVFNYQKIDENGRSLSYSHFQEGVYTLNNTNDKLQFILQNVLKYRIGWELWNRIYKRDIIEKNHIRFANENYAEDLFFFLCYIGCINNIICIKQNFYNYLIHPNSLMALSKIKPADNLNKVNNLSYELKKFYKTLDQDNYIECYYPLIHYNFLKQYIYALYESNLTTRDICKLWRTRIDRSEFCLDEFAKYIKNSKRYYSLSDKSDVLATKQVLQYYCDGKWIKFRIKSILNDIIKF